MDGNGKSKSRLPADNLGTAVPEFSSKFKIELNDGAMGAAECIGPSTRKERGPQDDRVCRHPGRGRPRLQGPVWDAPLLCGAQAGFQRLYFFVQALGQVGAELGEVLLDGGDFGLPACDVYAEEFLDVGGI